MSYLVLARKYRPTTFAEVVGQDHVTRTLGNAFAAGRVHHAFLFCGPRGCGKTTLARIVGKALNCEAPMEARPCNACSACNSINNGSAVDYIEMDGASNRGIDAIRELTDAVRYQPAVLRKKVYVIDEVHMLTTEAFNALLKTLEEPPPHVTFVLATTEPHKLPNTILSRCQRYDFKLVPAARLAQHLTTIFGKEKLPIEAGAVGLLVRESGGSVRDVLSLSDQIISYVGDTAITEQHVAEVLGVADRTLTRTLVTALAAGDAGAALASVESAIDRGVDEVQLARAIVRYLRDLSVLQVAPDRLQLVDATDEERAELLAESKTIERSRATQMFDRMLRCCDELGKTLQPRLVLDCALIDVATVEPLVPLGDLIDRLGDLEHRLASGLGPRAAGVGSGGGSRPAPSRPAPAPAPAPAPRAPAPPPAKAAPAPAPAPAPSAEPKAQGPRPEARSAAPPTPMPATMQPSGPVPAPMAPTAAGSGPTSDKLPHWDDVLTALEEQRKFTLFGWYQLARVMSFTADELVLGFPLDVHSMGEMASERGPLDDLRLVLQGMSTKLKNLKISVKMLDAAESAQAGARSVLESTRESKAAEKTKREAEARSHPMTKAVQATFGAQIKEIKTDV